VALAVWYGHAVKMSQTLYSMDWVELNRFHTKTDTEPSLRNVVFSMEDRKMNNVHIYDRERSKVYKRHNSEIPCLLVSNLIAYS
jgi:hypothetical protein